MRNRLPWLLLFALGIRLVGIQSRPIWYDEAFALLFSAKGPTAMLFGTLAPDASGSAADIHPILYYSLLWAWRGMLGETIVAGRLLSIVFGLITVALAYFLSKSLFGEKTALLAGLLVVASPFQVHFSQEIRMYSLLALWLTAATFTYFQAIGNGKTQPHPYTWALFALFAALAQYTHTLAAVYLIPLALIHIFRRDWRNLRNTILAGIAALIIYLPWLLQIPQQVSKVQTAYWTTRPSFARLFTTLLTFVTNLPLPDIWLPIGLFVTLLVTVLAGWQTIRAIQRRERDSSWGGWLLYLATLPALLLFAVSYLQPVYIERALLPSGVMFVLWLAWVFTRTTMPEFVRRTGVALIFVGFGVGLFQHVTYMGFPYALYSKLDASLASRLAPGDRIVHSNKLSYFPSYVYDPALPQTFITDPPGSGSDTLALPTQKTLGLFAAPSPEDSVQNADGTYADRVWFVIFSRAIEEYGDEPHPHLAWLDAQYTLVSHEAWEDLLVYEYIR